MIREFEIGSELEDGVTRVPHWLGSWGRKCVESNVPRHDVPGTLEMGLGSHSIVERRHQQFDNTSLYCPRTVKLRRKKKKQDFL